MGSNPCLTLLLVYSGIVTIALVITASLLGTAHTSVVCSGDGTEVLVEHYSIVDNSHDDVKEGEASDEPDEPCKCHCNCKMEELITGVEVFILTCLGVLILSLTIYSCLAFRFVILKKRKVNQMRIQAEADRANRESEQIEIQKRREWVREFHSEAIEMGNLAKQIPRVIPKDLE